MSEMGFENVFYLENFECAGDEVLVESSPPASPDMAARLAAPAQSGGAGGASPSAVRELIVIPELPDSMHLQHAIHQVSTSTVVEVNGDSSGQSSPNADAQAQHTYITVAKMQEAWRQQFDVEHGDPMKTEVPSDQESESGNGVNYHVQYVTEPQEIYAQGHQTMETLRSYPVYGVATVGGGEADAAWGSAAAGDYTAYGVVVAGDEAEAPASPATPAGAPQPPRMPPATVQWLLVHYETAEVAGDEAEAPASPATPAGAPQPPRMPPATVQWLLDHYETAEGVSLPRSTLYAHYLRHCTTHHLEPVNAASFGKLIRSVFVGLRTRRLGTRGNSKYHYYGIRAKPSAGADSAPDAADSADDSGDLNDKQDEQERAESREEGSGPGCGSPLGAAHSAHRQYLARVAPPSPPALALAPHLADDAPPAALHLLHAHHREHGAMFLEAVAALDTGAVEAARRAFWRRSSDDAVLCRRTLARLCARRDVCRWLRAADTQLYQRAVDMLLPDVLRPIPPQLTQSIRNFAKSVECAVSAGSGGAPLPAVRAQARAAAALAGALRRYTSLNHLAQAARAVLTNHHQIHQMVSDLNRVDFRVVREQASWACACASASVALKLEADFKATLGRGASLEQWAAWLERCVTGALAPHEGRADYVARARRLLLDWSFYSSLVIRELTLRSAASFGSFHLIRLLYDEYVSYLIERRVAAHLRAPPIAVMHRPQEDEEDEDGQEERVEGLEEDQDWDWEDEEEEDEPEHKKTKVGGE